MVVFRLLRFVGRGHYALLYSASLCLGPELGVVVVVDESRWGLSQEEAGTDGGERVKWCVTGECDECKCKCSEN